MSQLKIALVNLTNGGLSGGGRKYLTKIVPLLQEDPRVTSLNVFVPPQAVSILEPELTQLQTWSEGNLASGYYWLKRELHQLAPDVVFIPNARWLDCGKIPVVGMVRHMEPLTVPVRNSLSTSIKNLVRGYWTKIACERSNRMIAVSQYVRDFLVQHRLIDPKRVGCVYHGIESPPSETATCKPKMLQEKNLGSFIFAAGSLLPKRGLEDAIKAIATLSKQGLSYTLVIAGDPAPGNSFYKEQMNHLAIKCGVASQVVWAGQLNHLEMSWCFYNCAVFVMTSRVEACPNTVLEAMSHGCLCVSTNQPPMPEFFVDSAYYYQARDAEHLARQLITAISVSESEKQQKQSAVLVRASQFDWRTTAKNTISQLELALAENSYPP